VHPLTGTKICADALVYAKELAKLELACSGLENFR
jgi:hypothetical protein